MNNQVKIFLWCIPRCCSTAFSNAISKQENSKVFFEPFDHVYYLGEDRISKRFEHDPPIENSTYISVKKSLENEYNDYSVVFVKDMAYNVPLDRLHEILPEGYKHSFLIRHPSKTVASLYKVSTNGTTAFNYFEKDEAGFKSLHDLFFKIKEMTNDTPIVVEAEDLLENPDAVLRMYCQKTGMIYSDDMLKWELGGWKEVEAIFPGWQATLMESTGFNKPSQSTSAESITLSEEAKRAIEENLVYYNVLSKYKTPIS